MCRPQARRGTSGKQRPPAMWLYPRASPQAASPLALPPLTSNDGRITRIWLLHREDAAAARHLAAANDRDVAEVRSEISEFRQAAIASFNAMRSDLADLRTEMRTGFTEVRGQLDGAAAGLEQITGLLNTLIAQQGDQPGETS